MLNKSNAVTESLADDRAGPWIATTRVFIGLLLLYEVIAGGWWKLGTFLSGPSEDWLGANAGGDVIQVSERIIDEGGYEWYAILLEAIVLPYAAEWSYIATAAQLLTALALIVGLWTRPAALFGLLYFVPVFHFGTIRTSPLFAVPIAFVFVANAGRYYGFDAVLESRTDALGRATRSINRPLPITTRWYPYVAAGLAIVSVYYLLSMAVTESSRVEFIGLEMTIFAALTAGGLLLVARGATPTSVAADALRIFIGYRLFQEIFLRTDLGLPGWAPIEAQRETFESLAASHVPPVGAFIEFAILPVIEAWVVLFAVVQTVTAAALLVGWRTRLAGTIAAGYLLFLTSLGFTRLGPLFLASLVGATVLGGRHASLDSMTGNSVRPAPPLPAPSAIPSSTLIGLTVVVGIAVFGGILVVIDPSADAEFTGVETLVMLAFLALSVAVGVLESVEPTPSTANRTTGAD
jgi:hypothetical protein